jgi:hypothetical protein
VEAHADEMERALAPACRRHATCLTHPANSYNFCNDVLSAETADDCDVLFPASKSATDHEQCSEFHEVYLLGVDQRSPQTWNAAQACAAKNPIAHTKPLDIWMVPATIPFGTRKEVEFFSLDPDTRVPVLANINIQALLRAGQSDRQTGYLLSVQAPLQIHPCAQRRGAHVFGSADGDRRGGGVPADAISSSRPRPGDEGGDAPRSVGAPAGKKRRDDSGSRRRDRGAGGSTGDGRRSYRRADEHADHARSEARETSGDLGDVALQQVQDVVVAKAR